MKLTFKCIAPGTHVSKCGRFEIDLHDDPRYYSPAKGTYVTRRCWTLAIDGKCDDAFDTLREAKESAQLFLNEEAARSALAKRDDAIKRVRELHRSLGWIIRNAEANPRIWPAERVEAHLRMTLPKGA